MTMETPMPLNFRPHWQHFTPTSIHDHDLFGSLDCSQAQVVSHDLSASHHLWLQNMWQNGSQHATTGGCPGIFSASLCFTMLVVNPLKGGSRNQRVTYPWIRWWSTVWSIFLSHPKFDSHHRNEVKVAWGNYPWRIHVCMPYSWFLPFAINIITPVMLAYIIYHTYGSYGLLNIQWTHEHIFCSCPKVQKWSHKWPCPLRLGARGNHRPVAIPPCGPLGLTRNIIRSSHDQLCFKLFHRHWRFAIDVSFGLRNMMKNVAYYADFRFFFRIQKWFHDCFQIPGTYRNKGGQVLGFASHGACSKAWETKALDLGSRALVGSSKRSTSGLENMSWFNTTLPNIHKLGPAKLTWGKNLEKSTSVNQKQWQTHINHQQKISKKNTLE